ncbi:hypothetical protein [Bradyrhizobium neotropicale]|uniref:hypothetical protein n=1 Tax=Bradyrhizobium neotropicale TaxID=1497615 RepID=UPI001AD6AF50|nr:hypothetical protein [Bradyrhizobium neotropicale]MBO4225311.1 hypothetical protein [Bradyrhizobium neotropicale]
MLTLLRLPFFQASPSAMISACAALIDYFTLLLMQECNARTIVCPGCYPANVSREE